MNSTMSDYKIIQWNAQSLRAKKEEVLKMVEDRRLVLLAIQETMLNDKSQVGIPNYNIISKEGHFNWRSHGGAALLIHECSL